MSNLDMPWDWMSISSNTFGINNRLTLKQYIEKSKERTATYKEELFAKTWHPDRMIDWCLDAEERIEFLGV
jgi:hypothetical protein